MIDRLRKDSIRKMDLFVGIQEKKLTIENCRDAHEDIQSCISCLKEVKDKVHRSLKDEDDPILLEMFREDFKAAHKLRMDALKELRLSVSVDEFVTAIFFSFFLSCSVEIRLTHFCDYFCLVMIFSSSCRACRENFMRCK